MSQHKGQFVAMVTCWWGS